LAEIKSLTQAENELHHVARLKCRQS